jgi:hypothetical protein
VAQKPFPVEPNLDLVFHPEHDRDYVHFENGGQHPFQPSAAGGMSRVNAWWLADSALLSYWPSTSALAIFKGAGFECEYLAAGATNCYLAWRDGSVLVAFRGTQPDEIQDLFDDLNAAPVAEGAGEVHGGFRKALDRIWSTLRPRLDTLEPGRTVWFCGHSLGAALATLAAARYEKTAGIVTLGCPRVGDPRFTTAFNARFAGRCWRFVHDHDVVTHVPPRTLPILLPPRIAHFEHTDVRRFVAADGTVSTGQAPIPHFFDAIFGTLGHLKEVVISLRDRRFKQPPAFILDHMPKAYAVAIWNDYDRNG